MTGSKEWNEFLDSLLTRARDERKDTAEYEYRAQRRELLEERLSSSLNTDQQDMVEDILFELGLSADRESELLYRQGLRDCVWLLKALGVLA